jgi:hypothetical protein
MTVKEVFRLIMLFEYEAGEDFLDYNENIIKEYNLMFWLLGKNYLTKSQVNGWADNPNDLIDLNYLFSDYENPNTIFTYGPTRESDLKKNYIMSELISDFDILTNRLVECLSEFSIVESLINNYNFIEIDRVYYYIKDMTIEEINKIKEV